MKPLPLTAAVILTATAAWVSLAQSPPAGTPSDPAVEIEKLKTLVPDQAHVMADVGYHFTNAWFAGKAENWPLAKFYADETRSHILWAVRVKPVRKTAAGADIPMQPQAETVINGPFKELSAVIERKDGAAFAKAYETTLTACYNCHVVSEKPYLKLRVPEQPAAGIIDFTVTK